MNKRKWVMLQSQLDDENVMKEAGRQDMGDDTAASVYELALGSK